MQSRDNADDDDRSTGVFCQLKAGFNTPAPSFVVLAPVRALTCRAAILSTVTTCWFTAFSAKCLFTLVDWIHPHYTVSLHFSINTST